MDIFNAVSKQMDLASGISAKNVQKSETIAQTPMLSEQTSLQKNDRDKKEIEQQLKDAVKNLNNQMDTLSTNITFGYNEKLNSMYVDVKEKNTGKLIRKFPTEEAMKLSEHFKEVIGIIFDKKG